MKDATHNSVYVETSIPSFYYTLRTDPESVARMHWTRQWWAEYADACELTTSAAVIDELRKGTSERTEARIALLANAIVVPITEEVIRIAQVYIDRRVMPRDPEGDALHLALASYHKADFLLTWNCKHLANASEFHHIRMVTNFEKDEQKLDITVADRDRSLFGACEAKMMWMVERLEAEHGIDFMPRFLEICRALKGSQSPTLQEVLYHFSLTAGVDLAPAQRQLGITVEPSPPVSPEELRRELAAYRARNKLQSK